MKALETDISIGAPLGNLERGGSFTGDFADSKRALYLRIVSHTLGGLRGEPGGRAAVLGTVKESLGNGAALSLEWLREGEVFYTEKS